MANIIEELSAELTQLEHTATAFLIVTWICVSLRLYVRLWLVRSFGYDDWSLLASMSFFTVACAMGYVVVSNVRALLTGVTPNLSKLVIYVKLDAGFYVLSMVALKLSLGLFFLKVFTGNKIYRVLINIITTISVAFGLVCFFFTVLSCGIDSSFIYTGVCPMQHAYNDINVAWSILNAVTDFAFAILSVLALWNVQIHKRDKLIASALLALGTVGGVASCIRLGIIWQPNTGTNAFLVGFRSAEWTFVENGVGITAVALSALRPLVRQLSREVMNTLPTHITSGSNRIDAILSSAVSPKSHRSTTNMSHSQSKQRSDDAVELCDKENISVTTTGSVEYEERERPPRTPRLEPRWDTIEHALSSRGLHLQRPVDVHNDVSRWESLRYAGTRL